MALIFAPTAIDISRLPAPNAIETLDFEALYSSFKTRFLIYWNAQRATNPALPAYDTQTLETDPAGIVGEAWSYLRLLDRQRVNDAVKSLLAPLARGSDLDNLVARQGIERLIAIPANPTTGAAAVMESDERLLLRYLLSFDRAAAGSRDGYLFAAYTAWPGAGDIRVNGRAIHGRRGDVDIVICGPGGRLPTTEERALVRSAVTAPDVQPETTAVAVLAATRRLYTKSFVLEVPTGPDAVAVRDEALSRVRAAADSRTVIGGEVPGQLLPGAAYGASILRVVDLSELSIEPHPYTVPVLTTINMTTEVRT